MILPYTPNPVRAMVLIIAMSALYMDVSARRRRSNGRRRLRNLNLSGGRCEPIQVPICKGQVDYTSTKLPNMFGHTTQAAVYWAMQRWWPFIDAGCSDNMRNFVCGLYLPKCVGKKSPAHYPCQETCKKAKKRCKRTMRRQGYRWNRHFKCKRLEPRSSNKCITPKRETKKAKNRQYVLCEDNKLSMCKNIPFSQGSLPNMFLQSDLKVIEREMSQYKDLVASGCSRKLRLFLCGVFMPFCVQGRAHRDGNRHGRDLDTSHLPPNLDVPFLLPCREWCMEVQEQCGGEYQQRTHGLPWPGKFHCMRFPSYRDQYGGRNESHRNTIPCTMPPPNLPADN